MSASDAVITPPPALSNRPVGTLKRRLPKPLAATINLLILPIILALVWWVTSAVLNSAVFPDPLQAVQGLWLDFARPAYVASIGTTLKLLAIGLVAAAVIGALAGFALGLSKFWSAVFATPISAFYAIPKVTLFPVFLIFFGIGEESRLVFAWAHSVFPMALLVMAATAGIDRNYLKLANVLVLPWHVKLRKILIPALLPAITTALRIAFSLTLLGLILAGMISATSGLGHELVLNIANVRVDRIMGQILFIVVIAVIPGLFLRWLENRISSRYQPDERITRKETRQNDG